MPNSLMEPVASAGVQGDRRDRMMLTLDATPETAVPAGPRSAIGSSASRTRCGCSSAAGSSATRTGGPDPDPIVAPALRDRGAASTAGGRPASLTLPRSSLGRPVHMSGKGDYRTRRDAAHRSPLPSAQADMRLKATACTGGCNRKTLSICSSG